MYTVTQHEEKIETIYDRYYRFEGYKVYQLANAEVGADELSNTDKARLVFQCDVRNNVATLINYEYDEALQANIFDLWDQGRTIGEIVIEIHLNLDEFLEFFHYQGLI